MNVQLVTVLVSIGNVLCFALGVSVGVVIERRRRRRNR